MRKPLRQLPALIVIAAFSFSGMALADDPGDAKKDDGYSSLFDGKTLKGWNAKARLPVPKYPGGPF